MYCINFFNNLTNLQLSNLVFVGDQTVGKALGFTRFNLHIIPGTTSSGGEKGSIFVCLLSTYIT